MATCNMQGSFGTDVCGQCLCYSGYGGDDCSIDVSDLKCALTSPDMLKLKDSLNMKLGRQPEFKDGVLTVFVKHDSLPKKYQRKTYLSFGIEGFSDPSCSCWKHKVTSTDGQCEDEYILQNTWQALHHCCKESLTSSGQLTYSCNIHYKTVEFLKEGWRPRVKHSYLPFVLTDTGRATTEQTHSYL